MRAIGMLASFFVCCGAVGDVTVFHADDIRLEISAGVRYLRDYSRALDIAEVAALAPGAFSLNTSDIVSLGLIDEPVWVRLDVRNEHPSGTLVLEFTNPRTTRVELYRPVEGGQFEVSRAGPGHPLEAREIYSACPAFPIDLDTGTRDVYFLRLANVGVMRFQLRLWEHEAFHRYEALAQVPNWIVSGMLAGMLAVQLLAFLTLRERGYLYVALFVAGYLMVYLTVTGIGPMLLWPDWGWMGDHGPSLFILLTLSMAALFVSAYINREGTAPRWAVTGVVLGAGCLAAALGGVWVESITRMYILTLFCFAVPLFVLAAGILARRRKLPDAARFLLAWGSLSVAQILVNAVVLGLYPLPARGEFASGFIVLAAVVVWTSALIERVRAQDLAIRRMLEEQVSERTEALQQAVSQVKTLRGLLPICAGCKKIRDDQGYWRSVESYIHQHTEASLSHSLCPECLNRLYPSFLDETRPPPEGR